MKLTIKQRAFVDEYMVCRNGAEAARRAGYGVLSARVTASRLLTKANIIAYLAVKEAELAAKVEISKVRVVNELLGGIAMAESKLDPGTMIHGWIEIAKMLDLYKPEAQNVAPSASYEVLSAKYEAMSDEELMDVIAGKVVVAG
jgi:hypothetical protein